MEKMPITRAGFARLKRELEVLKTVSIPANIKDIETARAQGDLSENAEYSAAISTLTPAAAPVSVFFDEISSSAITASFSRLLKNSMLFNNLFSNCSREYPREKLYGFLRNCRH